MGRKRKPESRSTEPSEPPQKQQQQEAAAKEELVVEDAEQENIEEVEEIQKEEEEEVEEEGEGGEEEEEEEEEEAGEEEEEEGEEEEEDDEEEEDVGDDNQRTTNTSISGAVANDDEDDEPVEKLLEPFGKEQLINLLCEVSKNHSDIADRIRQIADEDPAHRKIFIHGLGWDTKAENLVEVFKQYGDIEDCKAVCDKISGKSKGYGFILFKSRRGARQALKEPQKKIGNRMTACQLASTGPVSAPPTQPNTTQQPQQQQQQQQSTSEYTLKKIFVSNVGADLDPQKLHSFFSKFGEIEEGPLGLDKATGKPKGFCLFVYKTVDDARKALEEPHKNFEGNILHCQKAIDGPKPGKSQQQQHHHNVRNPHFQRNENAGFVGGAAAAGHGHLMAPSGNGVGSAASQALNPALGHALTALLATQGAGLGLNPALGHALLGTLGTATGAGAGVQGVYGNQTNVTPNMIGGYGSQGGYPNQQAGQGGSGRGGQHGLGGQYGGVPPYMGQ